MAAKLQAAERGRSARAEAAAGQAAAAKLQAAERGRSTRAEDPRVHQAVASGDVAAVRALLSGEAAGLEAVQMRDSHGCTPLHCASGAEVVAALLASGARQPRRASSAGAQPGGPVGA